MKKHPAGTPIQATPISAHLLHTRQQQLLLIDVRSWLEYLFGHIPGARHLSLNRLLREVPKEQAIAVNCLSGHRSAIAAQWLIQRGYQQVYDLQGGVLAWQQAGYPLKRGWQP